MVAGAAGDVLSVSEAGAEGAVNGVCSGAVVKSLGGLLKVGNWGDVGAEDGAGAVNELLLGSRGAAKGS